MVFNTSMLIDMNAFVTSTDITAMRNFLFESPIAISKFSNQRNKSLKKPVSINYIYIPYLFIVW